MPSPLCGGSQITPSSSAGSPASSPSPAGAPEATSRQSQRSCARDEGGPELVGQLLMNPVTDSDMTTPSYQECAEGYILTKALMEWFFDHYMDGADRTDPSVAPLRASDLSGLPPTVIVTSEFDPLRSEGEAYAKALGKAGVATRACLRSRPHAHVADDGRCRPLERAREGGDGRRIAWVLQRVCSCLISIELDSIGGNVTPPL